MTTTTQDAFHSMRGHVADGVTVKMRNGDIVTIRAMMKGWQLMVGDIPHGATTNSAHVVDCLIYNYPNEEL